MTNQVIPEAAVEAAVDALRTPSTTDRAEGVMTWEQIARCVLEAAAPHMLAEAFDVGFTACARQHMRQNKDPNHPITRINPYRPTE